MAKKSFKSRQDIKDVFGIKEKFKEVTIVHGDDEYEFLVRKFNLRDRTEFTKLVAEYQKGKATQVDGDTVDPVFGLESMFHMLVAGLSDDQGNQLYRSKEDLLSELEDIDQEVAMEIVNRIMEVNGLNSEAQAEASKNSEPIQD